MSAFSKVFGTYSDREIKRNQHTLDKIESYRPAMM